MTGPNPNDPHPIKVPGGERLCYIKNTVTNPNIVVGEYTYYDDADDSENFERNVLYHFPEFGDKLIIGKFCCIAQGTKFLMNGANHRTGSFSIYPFYQFDLSTSNEIARQVPFRGDTVIGNDVWIGFEAVLMPGIKVGNGAVIAARSVVTEDVPAYSIVGGSPARVIRSRFEPEVVAELEQLTWWDWPMEQIVAHFDLVTGNDAAALKQYNSQQATS